MNITKIIKTVVQEYLFPVFCLSCEKEGSWLCTSCIKMLPEEFVCCCPVCHIKTGEGECCAVCKEKSFLSLHIALYALKERDLLSETIHTFKYKFAEDIANVFDERMRVFVQEYSALLKEVDLIIPIPLHKKRFAERGFNQSALLAKQLSSISGIPMNEKILIRARQTKQQALLGKMEREENVKEAFTVNTLVKGKKILLVDDVFTTGATMQEAGRALRNAGAREIVGFSVGRG